MMKDLSVHGESLSLDIDKTSMSLQVKGDDVNSKVTVKERDSKKARDLEEQIKKAEEDIEAETVFKNIHLKIRNRKNLIPISKLILNLQNYVFSVKSWVFDGV